MIWILLGILLVCSGLVSGSETALFALRQETLHRFRESTHWLARRAGTLMLHPRRVLMTVLISNTAINVAIFAVSYIAMSRLRSTQPAAAAASGVGVLLAVILFGELIPKAVAWNIARQWAPVAAGLISVLQTVITPVRLILGVLLVDPLTRLLSPQRRPRPISTDELRTLVRLSEGEGIIDSIEHEVLESIVVARGSTVREVMTPRVDVSYVRRGDLPTKVLADIVAAPHRMLPVCGKDLDDVLGIIRARDALLNEDEPVAKLMTPPVFVPEQIKLVQLLNFFREQKQRFAIVVDEYGGTAGVVSHKDVLKRILGRLSDEDEEHEHMQPQQIDDDTYLLPGELSIREWADRFGVREIDPRIDTVAGLFLVRLGRAPRVGDAVRVRNLTLTINTVRNRRIASIVLKREPVQPSGGEVTS